MGGERGCLSGSDDLPPLNVTIVLRGFIYVYRIILIEGQATLYSSRIKDIDEGGES